jgi:hypothetical protein
MSYRTYLLIANNFVDHYPHYRLDNAKTRELKEICHLFARDMYGDKFNAETGHIDFGHGSFSQVIKDDVAPVTSDMLKQFPKIAYYHKLNPNAHKGIELACIGEINIATVINYTFKFIQILFRYVFNPRQTPVVNNK